MRQIIGRALADRSTKPTSSEFVHLFRNVVSSVNTSQLDTLPKGVTPIDLMVPPSLRPPGHTPMHIDALCLKTQSHQQRRVHENIDAQSKRLRNISHLSVGDRVAVSVEHLPSKKSFADEQLTVLNRKDGRILFTRTDYTVVGVNEDSEPTTTYSVAHVDTPHYPLSGTFDRASLRRIDYDDDVKLPSSD